ESVDLITDYVRLLEHPARSPLSERGRRAFERVLCGDCHVPSLRPRPDNPIQAIAGIDPAVYTTLLLHDMGEALADGVQEGDASGREFRTAPLIGLRFLTAFLHDGRATSVEDAVLAHRGPGSEANESVERFLALSRADRAALLR